MRKNQVPAAAGQNRLLALKLALAVDAERLGIIGLNPCLVATAVEHVIGRVMHQQGAAARRFSRQHAWRLRIDQSGKFRFALGTVNKGVGCGIDDDVRR